MSAELTLRSVADSLARQTGCEVKPNALGNPMYTLTGYELIQLLLAAQNDATLAAAIAQLDAEYKQLDAL